MKLLNGENTAANAAMKTIHRFSLGEKAEYSMQVGASGATSVLFSFEDSSFVDDMICGGELSVRCHGSI